MCIIIAKARRQQGPTWDAIMNATQRNPDGFALAYSLGRGRKPRIIRSMKRADVLARGAQRAREEAQTTLARIRKAVGLA